MRKWALGAVLLSVVAGLGVVQSQTIASYFQSIVVSGSATIGGDANLTGNVLLTSNNPQIIMRETDGGTNAKVWRVLGNSEQFLVTLLDDGNANGATAYSISRTGATMGALTWGVTQSLGLTASASAPFYSFTGDPNTGVYAPGTDQVGVSTGGTLRTTWSTTSQTNTVPFLAPSGSAGAPAFAFSSDPDSGLFYSSAAINVAINGETFASFTYSTSPVLTMSSISNGTGARPGNRVFIGRNQSGSGAAGVLGLTQRNGTTQSFWVESNLLRMHTAQPTEDNTTVSHTAGGVVGDQTSFLASKDLLGQPTDASLLDAVLRTPVHHFRYKDGRYNGETFTGIVTDESPWFGKDHNRALNEINAVGYLVGAVRELERRLAASEARVRRLERQK